MKTFLKVFAAIWLVSAAIALMTGGFEFGGDSQALVGPEGLDKQIQPTAALEAGITDTAQEPADDFANKLAEAQRRVEVEERREAERLAEEQRLAKVRRAAEANERRLAEQQLLLEQQRVAKAKADAGPTFAETRDWIYSKFENYSSPWQARSGHTWNRRSEFDYGKGALKISNCSISSTIPFIQRYEGTITAGYYSYESYQLSELNYVYLKNGDPGSYDAFPKVDLTFQSKSGTFTVADERYSKMDVSPDRHLSAFFNYEGQESDMERRVKDAFLHLSDLARKNPACSGPIEVF